MLNINYSYLYHSKNNIIIIWQAKCACTIVLKMYLAEENLLEEALKLSWWVHDYREKYLSNKVITYNNNTKLIQFVVNPYRRIVSTYLHAAKNWIIDGYSKKFGINNNISFNTFLDFLIDNPFSNIHHNLQYFYLLDKKILKKDITSYNTIIYTFKYNNFILELEIVKMENINTLLPIINKKYNLNYTQQNSLHHTVKNNTTNNFLGNELFNNIKKIPKYYHYFYNDNIKQKVETLYSKDISTFNYTWEEFLE
tara:strand:+ start:35 stop:793 length:759 start_codon:yes stop_codon:yes gene_type:complete